MQITETQIAQVNNQIQALLKAESFYGKKLEEAGVTSIQSAEDFQKLPFSEKNDLRNAYPLGLMTAPEEKIVRIHSSSGTTGLPVIIPYTQKDVDDWAIMFQRCYELAGLTNLDRIQITPGYEDNRSRFYFLLRPASCRRNPKKRNQRQDPSEERNHWF